MKEAAVYLQSKVRLLGGGEESVLVKAPSVASKLSSWRDGEGIIGKRTLRCPQPLSFPGDGDRGNG